MIDALAVALQGAGQLPLLYATDGFIGQTPTPTRRGDGDGFHIVQYRAAKKLVTEVELDREDSEMVVIAKAFIKYVLQ